MYKNLKEEHLMARKARAEGKFRAALLGGVISDIDDKVLPDRKKAVTEEFLVPDAVVVDTLKNQIKTLNKGIAEIISKVGDVEALEDMREKIVTLTTFLPPAVEGDNLRMIIQDLGAENIGQAMRLLKKDSIDLGFDYDGREASLLAKEIFI